MKTVVFASNSEWSDEDYLLVSLDVLFQERPKSLIRVFGNLDLIGACENLPWFRKRSLPEATPKSSHETHHLNQYQNSECLIRLSLYSAPALASASALL